MLQLVSTDPQLIGWRQTSAASRAAEQNKVLSADAVTWCDETVLGVLWSGGKSSCAPSFLFQTFFLPKTVFLYLSQSLSHKQSCVPLWFV